MKPIIGITANYSFDGSSEFAEGIGGTGVGVGNSS